MTSTVSLYHQQNELFTGLTKAAILEIQKQYIKANKKEDWFYSFKELGWELFVAQNETEKFPEDY